MTDPDGPLAGLTVVERTRSVAGAYAGRVLAALGADTLLVEPPGGHRLRAEPPLVAPGMSSVFAYLAAGKRGLGLDLRDPADRGRFDELVAGAEVYIDDFPTAERAADLVDPDTLSGRHPDLIYVSVRPFGAVGPKSEWEGEELTLMHASGEGNLLPNGLAYERDPNRPPLKLFGHFAELQAGAAAALGVLASLVAGVGQVVDVGVQDAMAALTAFGVQRFGDGSIEHRSTRSFRYGGVLECADGYVELLTLEDRQWAGLVELLGTPGWSGEPEFADGVARGRNGAEINARLREWALTQRAADLVAAAQRLGVPAAKYATPDEILADPHERARGLFQSVPVPGLGEVPILTAPYQFDGSPMHLSSGPPREPSGAVARADAQGALR